MTCVDRTSATTYAVVGALNKIPISLFGWLLFGANITSQAGLFLCISLFGGILYSLGKIPQLWLCLKSTKSSSSHTVVEMDKKIDSKVGEKDEENGNKST